MAGSLSISACAKDSFDDPSLRKNPVRDFGTGRKQQFQVVDDAPVKREYREAPGTMRYPDVPEQSPAPPAPGTGPANSGATTRSSPIGDFGSSVVDVRARFDGYWRAAHAPAEKPPEAPASCKICPAGDFGDSHVDVKQVLKDHWSGKRNKRAGKQP